jgi:hypothetical protein
MAFPIEEDDKRLFNMRANARTALRCVHKITFNRSASPKELL